MAIGEFVQQTTSPPGAPLYYLQEDSVERCLTKLEMFFFSFSNSFFTIWLSKSCFIVSLSLICTYIPRVCNVLHLVSLFASFILIFLAFVSSIYTSVVCSNTKKSDVTITIFPTFTWTWRCQSFISKLLKPFASLSWSILLLSNAT